jgi:large-conductance mechanosensitive channel
MLSGFQQFLMRGNAIELAVGIGHVLNAALGFLIKAAGLYFLIVLPYTRLTARTAADPPFPPVPLPPSSSEQYLRDIRDLLGRRQA